MKRDYKAALYAYEIARGDRAIAMAYVLHDNTIRHALLMMQKLQEPSEGMMSVGYDAWHDEKSHGEVFKAMLEQAEKEIEQ